MRTLLILAAFAFALIAIMTPRVIAHITTGRRVRRPHAALVAIFRIWFALLSLATFWILLHDHRSTP